MNDLVSIIIPTRNRPEWLVDAIRSSQSQSHQSKEIIVVDDGSEPHVNYRVVEQFPEVNYIYQENSGAGAARNTGIAVSKGQFIQFLDDDDWLSTDAVGKKLAKFFSNPEFGCVYSDLYLTDTNGKILSRYFEQFSRPLPSGDLYATLIERNFIPVHAVLWKREVLEKIGGYPPYSGHEDWECVVRAAEFSTFSALDEPLGYYRQHRSNLTHAFDVMYQGKLSFQKYIVGSERFSELPLSQRTNLLSRFAFQQWAYGDQQKSLEFLRTAREENPVAIRPFLVQMLMSLGRPFSKILVKGRSFIWRVFNK